MQSTNTIALKWGLIGGAALVVAGVVYRVADVAVTSPVSWLFYALPPVAAWLAIAELRKTGSAAGFKAEFSVASYATVLAAAMYAISVVVYNGLIDASLLHEVEAYLRQAAVDAGKTGESLQQANQLARIFTQPVPFAIAIFIQLGITGLSSAVTIAAWNLWRPGGKPNVAMLGV